MIEQLRHIIEICVAFPAFYELLTLIPCAIVVPWAIIKKIKDKEYAEAVVLAVCAAALMLNGATTGRMMHNFHVPILLFASNMIVSCTILPQTYMYFNKKIGNTWSNKATISLWLVLLFLLLPNICIELQVSMPAHTHYMHDKIPLHYISIYDEGKSIYTMSLGSLIVLLQAIIIITQVPKIARTLKKYELRLTSKIRWFLFWWFFALIFIAYATLLPLERLQEPTIRWGYYIIYSITVTIVYWMLAHDYDANPIISSEEEEVLVDSYIKANQNLAAKARRLFIEEKLFLQPGIVIDDVVTMLGTNRTYFTRMMRAEFGMSFNEYIANERVVYAQRKMLNTYFTIDEIASMCGFTDASSFCRVFKRITGTSPDVWRKQNRENQ